MADTRLIALALASFSLAMGGRHHARHTSGCR